MRATARKTLRQQPQGKRRPESCALVPVASGAGIKPGEPGEALPREARRSMPPTSRPYSALWLATERAKLSRVCLFQRKDTFRSFATRRAALIMLSGEPPASTNGEGFPGLCRRRARRCIPRAVEATDCPSPWPALSAFAGEPPASTARASMRHGGGRYHQGASIEASFKGH
jgi:hypothetical protein